MRPIARAGAGLTICLFVVACGTATTPTPTVAPPTAAPPTAMPTEVPTEAPTEAPTAAPPTATAAAATCEDVTGGGAAPAVEAAAAGFEWAPADITAAVGDVITWTNADDAPHRVATNDGSCRMDSNMGSGDSRSLQFTAAGEYAYRCTIHPSMTGVITITE
jgi:plastocyanin